jgi:hypothetical protein
MTRIVQIVCLVVALSVVGVACSNAESDDPLNTPQAVDLKSPEREAEYLEAVTVFIGTRRRLRSDAGEILSIVSTVVWPLSSLPASFHLNLTP